jgi:hypothetical protein
MATHHGIMVVVRMTAISLQVQRRLGEMIVVGRHGAGMVLGVGECAKNGVDKLTIGNQNWDNESKVFNMLYWQCRSDSNAKHKTRQQQQQR